MNVSDIMTANPVTINPNKTVREALNVMERANFHHLPVVGSDGHLVGIVTDRDCVRALEVAGQDGSLTLVRSAMTPAPIIVEPDASADEAARLMLEHHISSLPVMRGETLIAIITTSDILMAFIRLHKQAFSQDVPSAGKTA